MIQNNMISFHFSFHNRLKIIMCHVNERQNASKTVSFSQDIIIYIYKKKNKKFHLQTDH